MTAPEFWLRTWNLAMQHAAAEADRLNRDEPEQADRYTRCLVRYCYAMGRRARAKVRHFRASYGESPVPELMRLYIEGLEGKL